MTSFFRFPGQCSYFHRTPFRTALCTLLFHVPRSDPNLLLSDSFRWQVNVICECFNSRLYSSINISADKWLLTLDKNSVAKLESPPSLADGLDKKTEQVRFLVLIVDNGYTIRHCCPRFLVRGPFRKVSAGQTFSL